MHPEPDPPDAGTDHVNVTAQRHKFQEQASTIIRCGRYHAFPKALFFNPRPYKQEAETARGRKACKIQSAGLTWFCDDKIGR